MDASAVDVDSTCSSGRSAVPAPPGPHMYGLFTPGSSFHLGLLDPGSSRSSEDPIRADRSLSEATRYPTRRRTSVHIQMEDDDYCNRNQYHLSNSDSNYKDSSNSKDELLSDNLSNNPSIHGEFIHIIDNLVAEEHSEIHHLCLEPQIEKAKLSVFADTKPSVTSFLTMENSSNAIDNNFHVSSMCAPSDAVNNHVFKLPIKELTFNGTLKHLQKLHSSSIEANTYKEDFKYKNVEPPEEHVYKSSDDMTSNSCPSTSNSSSKSSVAVYSSASQFPSDCDQASKAKDSSPNNTGSSSVTNMNFSGNLTFAGAVSPMRESREVGGHDRSGESLASSFQSGAQSPNMFSDDEEADSERLEMQRAAALQNQFEKSDKLLVRTLEKTVQGVLPPPSVTICQLTLADILALYKQHLPKFSRGSVEDCGYSDNSLPSTSRTPPRSLSCDGSLDPSISASLAMALETTLSSRGSDVRRVSDRRESEASVAPIPANVHGTEDDAKNADWPQLLQCRYYGVHYNSTSHTERLDCLWSRYATRFIGCETASSWGGAGVSSGPRRPVRPPAQSPGRRLSHLARRRTAFCSVTSLEALAPRRQILIDRKKFSRATMTRSQTKRRSPRGRVTPSKRTPGKKTPGKKTPGRKTPGKKTPGKKTPAKKTPVGKTPGSSQRKRAVKKLLIDNETLTKSLPTRETTKRALFLSPENIMAAKPVECQSAKADFATTRKAIKSKRSLFGSPKSFEESSSDSCASSGVGITGESQEGVAALSKKRERNDDSFSLAAEDLQKSKLHRSLSFGGDKVSDYTESGVKSIMRRASEYLPSNGFQSDLHKKKLLWAVAEALRAHSIGVTHADFKKIATPLARLTRKLCTLPVHARALRAPSSSTSDTLLRIARLHVFAVIKGRTVEELFLEEQSKQAPTKVTGYVPLAGAELRPVHNSENSYGDIKDNFRPDGQKPSTVLQDKSVNFNNVGDQSSDVKKPVLFRDNGRLRARRQISFDNMDDPCRR